MQRLIVLFGCILAITFGAANLAMAQTDAAIAEGQEKAAAGDIKGALQVYLKLT